MVGAVVAVITIAYGALLVASLISKGERVRTDHFAAASLRGVDARIPNGSVRVTGTETDEVVVRADITEGLFRMRYRTEVRGGLLEVRAHCPIFVSAWCSADLTIEVPRSMALELHSSNGSLAVEGVDARVAVSSNNGDIRLSAVSGEVSIDTDNGTVSGDRLAPSTLRGHSDNGDLRLDLARPARFVDLTTDNGTIELGLPDASYALQVATDNGSVRTPIRTDPASRYAVTVRSHNGDVTVRYSGNR